MKKNRSKLQKAIQTPGRALMNIIYHFPKFSAKLDDEKYVRFIYKWCFKKKLDLENPKTFSEKLQWIKLYDHNELYTRVVDKYAVKEYIASQIGEEYIIPTLGVYNSFDEIDFDKLPNQFVIKCTHDSGGVVVCKNKNTLDKQAARKKIEYGLSKSAYWGTREYPYKNVPPRIIVEVYMEDESGYELKDYKIFCFGGKPEFLFVATDRGIKGEETKFDFFDLEWNHLPFTNGHPNSTKTIKKPESFEKMVELSAQLSQAIPHVRVDLYNINGKIYFGELTFFHWSGMTPFVPEEWDYKFGEMIHLPSKN